MLVMVPASIFPLRGLSLSDGFFVGNGGLGSWDYYRGP